jgi:hypothetical protein
MSQDEPGMNRGIFFGVALKYCDDTVFVHRIFGISTAAEVPPSAATDSR